MLGETVSHYKILEFLGIGGMGLVYKAEDLKLKRRVALKFLPVDRGQSALAKERFLKEAQTASSLDHPNISNIHGIEESADGRVFIVMSFYPGETLRSKLERGPLPLREAIDVTLQVARGLGEAHAHGIVHRDIKPANLIVTPEGVVKILDFGLAKLAGELRQTRSGTAVGTVSYMSPEQARGAEADLRSDIWSLGVVLYEMLSGRHPFEGESVAATILSILKRSPPSVRTSTPAIPHALDRIVTRALAKDPLERYQKTSELLQEVESASETVLLETAVEATKELPPRRRFGRRPIQVAAGAALVTLAVGAYFVWHAGQAGGPAAPDGLNARVGVAVLPLQNFSGDPDQEYFAEGMTDALITDLAKISGMRVISRTSVMRYRRTEKAVPEIARELGVAAVVEGSVTLLGDRVRISVQLIDGKTDEHLWAERYERTVRDVLKLQGDLAKAIAREVKVTLTPQEEKSLATAATVDPQVYQLYLKGRYYSNKRTVDGLEKSLQFFAQAIDMDRAYARAHAGRAGALSLLALYGHRPVRTTLVEARSDALRAVALDLNLAEAHASLAIVKHVEWDWAGAEAEYRSAITLGPGQAEARHWHANYLAMTGHVDEAISEITRAQELDPLSLTVNAAVGWVYYVARRYDRAAEQFRLTLELDPNFVPALTELGKTYSQMGMHAEAVRTLTRAVDLSRESSDSLAALAHAYARTGKRREALRTLDRIMKLSSKMNASPGSIAAIYGCLSDSDRAFAWLEQAFDEHDVWLAFLKAEPMFDCLRTDPRYARWVERVGFDP